MPCVSPIQLKTGDVVPCSKCNLCLANKRNAWSFRLKQELKTAKAAFFVTLTYSDSFLPGDGGLVKSDFQNYMKRVRKKVKVRYYAVGEYGENTMRPHYHALVFGSGSPGKLSRVLTDSWSLKGVPMGHVLVGSLTHASIHYTTKYVINKSNFPKGLQKPFSLMSRRPAIGYNYIVNAKRYHKRNKSFLVNDHGHVFTLPRYYKEKIFSKLDRQIYNIELQNKLREKEEQELIRVSAFTNDPIGYKRYQLENLEKSINTKLSKTRL